jgi:hypothetical protein
VKRREVRSGEERRGEERSEEKRREEEICVHLKNTKMWTGFCKHGNKLLGSIK